MCACAHGNGAWGMCPCGWSEEGITPTAMPCHAWPAKCLQHWQDTASAHRCAHHAPAHMKEDHLFIACGTADGAHASSARPYAAHGASARQPTGVPRSRAHASSTSNEELHMPIDCLGGHTMGAGMDGWAALPRGRCTRHADAAAAAGACTMLFSDGRGGGSACPINRRSCRCVKKQLGETLFEWDLRPMWRAAAIHTLARAPPATCAHALEPPG